MFNTWRSDSEHASHCSHGTLKAINAYKYTPHVYNAHIFTQQLREDLCVLEVREVDATHIVSALLSGSTCVNMTMNNPLDSDRQQDVRGSGSGSSLVEP